MNLFSLLTEQRPQILERCREKITQVLGSRSSAYQLDTGLPTLYEELVEVLRISLDDDTAATRQKFVDDNITVLASRRHATESHRHGYTISQMVHGYGCICQGITEYAHDVGAEITSAEFSQLNLCLDVAIAQATAAFEEMSLRSAGRSESLRLGYLAHELRNSLSHAMMAHELIRQGGVGAAGATASVLTNAHHQMKEIIDRAMAEVRLQGESIVEQARILVFSMLSEIESSALPEANAKKIKLIVEADTLLEIEADRHLMMSAIANLVQNAIKFTHEGGEVRIRAFKDKMHAIIEIEDRCGGLPPGIIEELFTPYTQTSTDKSGLGLGLSIARRAIDLNGGILSARDLPGTGCVFEIRMFAYVQTLKRAQVESVTVQ